MADAASPGAPTAEVQEPSQSEPVESTPLTQLAPTPEELVAKAIAPVKREYLRPPPVRSSSSSNSGSRYDGGGGSGQKPAPSGTVVKEKKSKRQLKRERIQERKSVSHICPDVAKTGNPSACQYGMNCRFSHDLVAFLAQKPDDLPGDCPFLSVEGPCPYGAACRFSGTHKKADPAEKLNTQRKNSEINGLKKDVQKLLWKNQMCFPRADPELKRRGLVVKENPKARNDVAGKKNTSEAITTESKGIHKDDGDLSPNFNREEDPQPICLEKDCVIDEILSKDSHPQKKPKVIADGMFDMVETINGTITPEREVKAEYMVSEGTTTDEFVLPESDNSLRINVREKRIIDFRGKLYLAPLTTVGNLPFRRVCKGLGADITCGEMAMCTNLLQGQASEWALLRRHPSEDLFGVQICGAYPDTVARTVDLIDSECRVDFIDINMGCPIDIVVNKGAGSSLLVKPMRMKNIIQVASSTVEKPVTVKVRTGYFEGRNRIDSLIADMSNWGASSVTIHGRSRQQRYSKLADWDYIYECARKSPPALQVLGNGDIFSYTDWNDHISECPELTSCMIARGALIKPWIFTEIKEQRHWDISSGERLNILKDFVHHGLEHWGSDSKGVETTRHFLLEWLSYTHRYIPVGLLDVVPQRLNWRPPSFYGRDELETMMSSDSAADWIRISEILLGKVPIGFTFAPKHKSNAYERPENG